MDEELYISKQLHSQNKNVEVLDPRNFDNSQEYRPFRQDNNESTAEASIFHEYFPDGLDEYNWGGALEETDTRVPPYLGSTGREGPEKRGK